MAFSIIKYVINLIYALAKFSNLNLRLTNTLYILFFKFTIYYVDLVNSN